MDNFIPYLHDTQVHNLQAPREIVPLLIKMFSPQSVIDVGCGLGTFLHVFLENGISDITGIDGSWVNRDLLSENIPLTAFHEVNLEEEYKTNRKYDMVVCLEVVEHLPSAKASNIISTLTNLGDIIVFSAAIPNQGGQNHINEQWITYWEKLFNEHHYILYDIVRPQIWDNPNIFFWYKQNMVIFAKEGCHKNGLKSASSNSIRNIVHPDLFMQTSNTLFNLQEENDRIANQLNRLLSGRYPLQTYLSILWQYINLRLAKLNPTHYLKKRI